jgi:hypothetical protein
MEVVKDIFVYSNKKHNIFSIFKLLFFHYIWSFIVFKIIIYFIMIWYIIKENLKISIIY